MVPYIYIVIPTYGLLVVIGAAIALSWLYYRGVLSDEETFRWKDFLLLVLVCGIGCFVGSKVLFFLTQLPAVVENFSVSYMIETFAHGGFVFYGGLFGALAGVVLFAKSKKYDVSKCAGFVLPAFIVFHAFGRIGCFASGCCHGFLLPAPISILNVTLVYFPIQLVEALFELGMFFYVKRLPLEKRTQRYLLIYACYRFAAEFFRGDVARGIWFGLSTSQWVSLIVLVFIGVKIVMAVGRKTER